MRLTTNSSVVWKKTCGIYIHDITSTYYNDTIFEELDADILNFSRKNTHILFMGDFNGRTGNLNDNYEASKKIDNIPIANPFSELLKRYNCDSVINSHGEKIMKMCKTYDFKMLNGRTKGDSVGNYTHFNNNKGTSTACNQHIYKYVENLVILPMNELSDHSKIVTFLKSIPQNKVHDDYNWKNLN